MTNGMKHKRNHYGSLSWSWSAIRLIVFCALLCALFAPSVFGAYVRTRGGEMPASAWTMLFAAKRSGMNPTGFYASGSVVVNGGGEAVLEAARRVLRGVPNAQAETTEFGGVACVAVSIVCAPDPWAAAETLHRIQSALGWRADVTLCLVGRAAWAGERHESISGKIAEDILSALGDEPRSVISGMAANGYVSAMGEKYQTAVRANGEIYIGMPRIVLDY